MKYPILAALLVGSTLAHTVHAASVPGQGTWETTLQGRDLDGNRATAEAWYDTVLDITWLADANYAKTSGHDTDGRMTWANANSWAAGLEFGGIDNWRLPDTNPVDGSAYDYDFSPDGSTDRAVNISAPGSVYAGSTGSEMAYLYYNTLGNLGRYDSSGDRQPGCCLTNSGPFQHVRYDVYWSATEYAPDTSDAWIFYMSYGTQTRWGKEGAGRYAWAVHSGDVGATVVPIPAAAWLFGGALLGLVGIGAKRKR